MTSLPDEIGRLAAHLIRRARTDGSELALTATQRLALTETALHSPLRLGDLAERMGVSDATASRAVETLVGFGLVERTPDPNDRRAVVIEPTADGRKRFAEQRRMIESALRKLAPADRKQLTALLARLNDALD